MELKRGYVSPTGEYVQEVWTGEQAEWVWRLHNLASVWGWTENRFCPDVFYVWQGDTSWTVKYVQ